MDQVTLTDWHDFYVTMGTASASLIGLLFVALSLNLEAITGGEREDLRAYAEQAFSSFSVVLLIAVFFLIPEHNVSVLGGLYVLLGAIAAYRILRRAPAAWRARQRDRHELALFWRFVLPAAAVAGLVAAGVGLVMARPDALYWLPAVIIGLLMSAARSAWNLLVKFGEERRLAKGAA